MERGITSMLNVEKIEQTKRKKGMTCGYWIHCENNVMIGLCEKIGQTTHHDYTHTFFQEVGCDWIYDVCTQTNGGSWLAGIYEPRKLSVGSPAKVNSRVSVRFCEVFTMRDYVIYTEGKNIVVLKRWGIEQGIPVYGHYKTFQQFDKAADLVRKLES